MDPDGLPPAQGDERCRQAQNITFWRARAVFGRNATPGRPPASPDSLTPSYPARVAQPACRCAPVCPPPLNTDRLCLLFVDRFYSMLRHGQAPGKQPPTCTWRPDDSTPGTLAANILPHLFNSSIPLLPSIFTPLHPLIHHHPPPPAHRQLCPAKNGYVRPFCFSV